MYEHGVTFQYICNISNGATDTVTLGQNIAAGSAALVRVSTNAVQESDMTSTAGLFRIVQKTAAGQLIYSPEFNLASKSTVTSKVYTAPVEQLTYYGYNGVSGSLGTIVSGATYVLSTQLTSYAPGLSTTPLIKTIPYIATSAVEADLALGMSGSFLRVFGRDPYQVIQNDVIASAAVTASNGPKNGQDPIVVNGSIAITFETDVTYEAAGGATLVVGDYLRLGSVGGGTALTDPVYKVTAIDSLVVTVDRPVTNASGTYTAVDGTSDIEVIPAATAIASDYGWKFTGIDRFADGGFNPQNDFYSKTRFEIASSDFDAVTVVTESAVASEGVGTAYEVAQFESKQAMNDGAGKYASAYPATVYRSEADLATPKTYDTMQIDAFTNEYVSRTTGQMPVSTFTILIRTEVSLAGDDIDTALNVSV